MTPKLRNTENKIKVMVSIKTINFPNFAGTLDYNDFKNSFQDFLSKVFFDLKFF